MTKYVGSTSFRDCEAKGKLGLLYLFAVSVFKTLFKNRIYDKFIQKFMVSLMFSIQNYSFLFMCLYFICLYHLPTLSSQCTVLRVITTTSVPTVVFAAYWEPISLNLDRTTASLVQETPQLTLTAPPTLPTVKVRQLIALTNVIKL